MEQRGWDKLEHGTWNLEEIKIISKPKKKMARDQRSGKVVKTELRKLNDPRELPVYYDGTVPSLGSKTSRPRGEKGLEKKDAIFEGGERRERRETRSPKHISSSSRFPLKRSVNSPCKKM